MSGSRRTLLILAALSGPDWEEGSLNTGDAGNLPDIGQVPQGQPPFSDMNSIGGELEGFSPGPPDLQDLFSAARTKGKTVLVEFSGPG